MIKGVIFDWNRTLWDKENNRLMGSASYMIRELKKRKYKISVISKGTSDSLKKSGLEHYFDHILFVESKAEQHMIECLNEMRLKHNETLVVGDRIKGEIKVGNSLGMKTCWFRNGKFANELPETDAEKPTHTITELRDVLKLI